MSLLLVILSAFCGVPVLVVFLLGVVFIFSMAVPGMNHVTPKHVKPPEGILLGGLALHCLHRGLESMTSTYVSGLALPCTLELL